jgi:hypothetical protein
MLKKRLYFPMAALVIAALAACNLPNKNQSQGPDAAFTAAAQTVEAQLTGAAQTQAASVSTATNTPLAAQATPTATSAPLTAPPANTEICDQALFITDVTVSDGTNFNADDTFTKTWRVKNTGTCSWSSSYTLAFASGNSMNGPSSVALAGIVNPGDTVDISVNLKAPSASGDYTGYWKLRNATGFAFITLTVVIHVGAGGGGAFAVTHVEYSTTTWNDAGHTNCPQVNASITTNGAGTVQYHWVRSDSSGATNTLTFSAAGTQTIAYKWALGSAATPGNWVGIYIDEPNHQDFGHTNVTPCTVP